MLLIVGDSRVRYLERALTEGDRKKFGTTLLSKSGARISNILEMLNQYKDKKEPAPEMIVIVGLICDVLIMRKGEEHPTFSFREEVYAQSLEYPALGGAEQMRQNVEDELEGMWPGVRTVWVLPFPIDLGTFAKEKAGKRLSRQAESAIDQVTLRFNNYMSVLDKTFQKSTVDMDVIPWFAPWKEVSGQRIGAPCEFRDFMARLRRGERVPSLYPESSVDGLHPQVPASQALLRIIFRKYKFTLGRLGRSSESEVSLPPTRDQSVQVSMVPTVLVEEAVQPVTVDRAVQIDSEEMAPSVLDSPVQTCVILPCEHRYVFVKEEPDKFLCEECKKFFKKEDLYVFRRWYIYKSKDAPPPNVE